MRAPSLKVSSYADHIVRSKGVKVMKDKRWKRRYNTFVSVEHRLEKFNIVSNDHGCMQQCDFCVSVCKTNFTDHQTPGTIHGFRDSVLVCKMHDCYCTIHKNVEHLQSYSSALLIKRLQWLDFMKTNHFKMLLNVFNSRYTYSNCLVYRVFYC